MPSRPYSEEISRTKPSCIAFMIDQSGSMAEGFDDIPAEKAAKAQSAADAINRCIANIIMRCTKDEGIRDYFYVGIWGYGSTVAPILSGMTPETTHDPRFRTLQSVSGGKPGSRSAGRTRRNPSAYHQVSGLDRPEGGWRNTHVCGARLDYEKAIELDPRFSAAYNSRGVLRRRQGDLSGSRADYDRAIALNPVEATYFRNRANLRRQQGDLKGSLEDYDQAVTLDGKDSIAFNSRGVVREALGNQSGALADYDKAIELNPGEPSFYQNRSNLKRTMGDLKGAQADLDRAVSLRSR